MFSIDSKILGARIPTKEELEYFNSPEYEEIRLKEEKMWEELKSDLINNNEYDPELIALAEKLILDNPEAFKNFL